MSRLFNRSGPSRRPDLIVLGLGNPAPKYADTRHNLGFMCIDHLAREHSIRLSDRRRYAGVGEGRIGGSYVVLAKPRTYVNLSGQAARYLLDRYRVSPDALIVIYDDLDLPTGKMRIRPKGSAGGHNGLKAIIEAIKSTGFPRIRVGIGRPVDSGDFMGYVLGPFSQEEREPVKQAIGLVAQSIEAILEEGLDAAMTRFN